MSNKKFIPLVEAKSLLNKQSEDFTIINNPDYVHPAFEIVPLAKKTSLPLNEIKAVVMDMDGTTTTTEALCIHSLEYMVRKMSGKMLKEDWLGLDANKDYQNIIGNSTTKHVEYLINKYSSLFKSDKIVEAFTYAAIWTWIKGKDDKRKEEVLNNLNYFCFKAILDHEDFIKLKVHSDINSEKLSSISKNILSELNINLKINSDNDFVRIGIDIYYQRYHEILEKIKNGGSENVSKELFGNSDKHLIEPMPGLFIFISLLKGWLDDEIKDLIPQLITEYETKSNNIFNSNLKEITEKLLTYSNYFKSNPVKVAIVTSSIRYEAEIVINEMIKIIQDNIAHYNLSSEKKLFLTEMFSNSHNLYDSFVTASDSSEIRLKPHRDLYSIALHNLGIQKKEFDQVIGFEDSESGTIAIRAAGIGMCVAVPFAETSGHNLEAASYICKGGLAEILLNFNLIA